MEKNYVTVEVGFDALFNAMITRATEDMASKNIKVADDAKKGLSEWLMVTPSLIRRSTPLHFSAKEALISGWKP